MIYRSVIKSYIETIELLVLLVNLGCRGLKQNVFIFIAIKFILQYFSNGLNAEPPRNWLFGVSALNHAKRTMIRLI